jgi:chaperonin GroES
MSSTYSRDTELCEKSGLYTTQSALVSFLYELMRDHVTPGDVEGVLRNSINPTREQVSLSNGWLARYAENVISELLSTEETMTKAKAVATNYRPIGERLLVRIEKPREETEGGILLPHTAQEKFHRGEVVAISPKVESDTGLKVGSIVLHKPYAGFKAPGDELLQFMDKDDIVAEVLS